MMRVHALAKELNVESKVLLTKLKSAGISAASHQSTLTDDDVEKMRVAFGVTKAKAGGSASSASRPKTILRRRKASDAAEDGESDSSDSTEAPQPTVAAEATAPEPVAPVQPEPPVQVQTPPQPEPVDSAAPEPEPEPQVETVQPVAAQPTQPSEPVKDQKPQPAARGATPPRRQQGGATIVRRATQEELDSLEDQTKRRTGRREDHRGTRVTGMGLLSNRMTADQPQQSAQSVPDPFARDGGVRPARGKFRDAAEEEQSEEAAAIAAKTKKQRRVHATLTTRALLSQTDGADSETEELVEEVAADTAAATTRSVYTPTATNRKRDLKRRKDLKKTQITQPRAAYRVVKMGETITVGELARQLSIKAADIIKKLMTSGEMVSINQAVDLDTATLIATEYNYEVKSTVTTVDDILARPAPDESELIERAPIVTVMGHVDHGKTSILDAIKKSNVASGEAGGITQHIGAYSVEVSDGKRVTFLDTPGHEAFSAMRARGAKVTDIVVLVVAADDGVMPQTVEAIHHAKAANVPIIVAVNKIDKHNLNFDRVYTELTEHGVQAEEWGGETQFVKCSAMTGQGLDQLLDAILLQAEVLELQASPQGPAEGVVIEAHLDRGRGPVATLVVQRGTLRTGDYIVAGTQTGRVRAMHDHRGADITEAGPSTPVEIIGLSGVPMAGDQANVVADEKTAKSAADWRIDHARKVASSKSSAASLEDLLARVQSSDVPEVPIIVKGDTQGSVEAVSESIVKLNTEKVKNRIVHAAVGGVTESDITLAATSGAVIIGFNVRAARGLDEVADREGVIIKYFSIIYEIVDTVKSIMVGKLPPIVSEITLGHAEVRKSISVPKLGTIAGSAVVDGKITRNAHCRLIRDDIVIYVGKLGSLRRFKDDVKEVAQGYECGIGIDGYNDIREGDVIEAYVLEETAATL